MATEPSASDYASFPRVWRPRASPTGEHVAFFWNPDGPYELFVYDIDAGEQWRVTDGELHRSPNAPVVWASSGQALYVQTGEHGYALGNLFRVSLASEVEEVATPGGGWGMLWGVDPTETWLLCSHDSDGEAQRLYRYEIEDGSRTLLSGSETTVPNRGARISPEGERVCYPGNAMAEPGNRDAFIVDTVDPEPYRLPVAGTENVRTQAWHPDGRHILVYDEDGDRTGEFDLDTEETRWFGSGTPLTYPDTETVLTQSPERIYDRASGEYHTLDISGRLGDELVADGVVINASEFLFTQESDHRPPELYRYEVKSAQSDRLVNAEFGSITPQSLATYKRVTYPIGDGEKADALLYQPKDTEGQMPVIVEAIVHRTSLPQGFKPMIQFLVSRGYAVLQPKYRGGKKYEQVPDEDWGGREQDRLVAAAEWLTEASWADQNRLGIYGHSFGGFTVYTQLVRYPETWTAGIASAGLTDLHLLDAAKNGDDLLRGMLGHPRENAALWRERSPITHIENIERPLLILHGSDDPTCPVSQAWAFKGALESVRGWTEGEDFEYEGVETGEHGNLDQETNAHRWELILDFLNRRL